MLAGLRTQVGVAAPVAQDRTHEVQPATTITVRQLLRLHLQRSNCKNHSLPAGCMCFGLSARRPSHSRLGAASFPASLAIFFLLTGLSTLGETTAAPHLPRSSLSHWSAPSLQPCALRCYSPCSPPAASPPCGSFPESCSTALPTLFTPPCPLAHHAAPTTQRTRARAAPTRANAVGSMFWRTVFQSSL